MDEGVRATIYAVKKPIDADETAAVPNTAACVDAAVAARLLFFWWEDFIEKFQKSKQCHQKATHAHTAHVEPEVPF